MNSDQSVSEYESDTESASECGSETDTASECEVENDSRKIQLEVLTTAFKSRIKEYVLKNLLHIDPKSFLKDAFKLFKVETMKLLRDHNLLKIHTSLKATFSRDKITDVGDIEEEKLTRFFNTKSITFTKSTNLKKVYTTEIVEKTLTKLSEFQLMGSGWSLSKVLVCEVLVDGLYVNNCKCECFNGSSYMPLPKFIENKKATVNIKNEDQKCFLWCVLAALHHDEFSSHWNRVSNYKRYQNELNMKNIDYPVSLQQIERFEKQNNEISINVYSFSHSPRKQQDENGSESDSEEVESNNSRKKPKYSEKRGYAIYPIRLTKNVKPKHIHLLLISNADLKGGGGETLTLHRYLNKMKIQK